MASKGANLLAMYVDRLFLFLVALTDISSAEHQNYHLPSAHAFLLFDFYDPNYLTVVHRHSTCIGRIFWNASCESHVFPLSTLLIVYCDRSSHACYSTRRRTPRA